MCLGQDLPQELACVVSMLYGPCTVPPITPNCLLPPNIPSMLPHACTVLLTLFLLPGGVPRLLPSKAQCQGTSPPIFPHTFL